MPALDRPDAFRARYGPWAVVTGASDGIGRGAARHLAEAGLHLVLVARRGAVLEALADVLRARHGVEVRVVEADLGTEAGLRAVEDAAEELDVGLLVAAAGFGTSGPFLESDLGRELDLLAVNGRAVLRGAHVFGRRFAARGRGGIVLFGSVVGFQGTPYAAHYAATKAYVQTLAEGLHVELAPRGVNVLASAPGPTASGFAKRAGMHMAVTLDADAVARTTLNALGRRQTVLPGWLSKLLRGALMPLPRWARPRILAGVMRGITAPPEAPASAPRGQPSQASSSLSS